MSRRLVFIMTGLLAAMSARAFDESFAAAQEAYDAGRYAEAAEQYEVLLNQGIKNAAVHYNLANARFKSGDLPAAVRHYRCAWYQSPRDPDIEANLSFALSAAGAAPPNPGRVLQLLRSLSMTEWLGAATALYVLLCLALIAALLLPRARRALLKAAGLLMLGLALCTAGWWSWHRLEMQPEGVVVKNGATTRYGPVEGATAYYKLPLGALVRRTATDAKGWVEVVYDGKAGWIRQTYIEPVSP